MSLRIEAERWCDCELQDMSDPCGEAAITLCAECGVALCESHEIVCPTCTASTCVNCHHACSVPVSDPVLHAA
jgi:hypothetical protein